VISKLGFARCSRPTRPPTFFNDSAFTVLFVGTVIAVLSLTPLHAAKKLGFNLDKAVIPVAEMHAGGPPRAYPNDRLPDGAGIEDTIGVTPVRVRFDRASRRITISDAAGDLVPFTPAYWFAWQAFHPNPTVWAEGQQ